jgi:cupin 2 domain-containing protein
MANIFDLSAIASDQEVFEPLLENPDLLIERIVSTGRTTPEGEWYDQSRDEWVILLQGEAEITYEDGRAIVLKPGDYLLIPAHQKHRVTYTSTEPACVWLAIHGKLNSPLL